MARTIPLFLLLAIMAGCAASARRPLPEAEDTGAPSGQGEQFDPESLQEDMLLIQPVATQPPQAPAPTVPATPATRPTTGQAAAPPSAAGPVLSGQRLYRVQVLALSNPDSAARWQGRLQSELGVSVRVDQERGRYLVRVGAFATDAEARRFAEELAAAHPERADAYVVNVPADTTGTDSTGTAAQPDSLAPVPAPNLVPAFGWRILLDQFESHEQAEQFRRRAMERLGRADIDITFKAPWYKVQVGNFRSEGHAQDAFQALKQRYPDAVLVRSQILVPAGE